MPEWRRGIALRRELSAAERIPYSAHVTSCVVRTVFGDYLQAFRLGGAAFESADDAELNNWHERLNVLWRNIASPNVALWTHVIRRRAQIGSIGAAPSVHRRDHYFADRLLARYQQRICGETLMQNEIYLSVLYRPAAGLATGLVSRVLARTERDGVQRELAEALHACEKLAP